MDPDVHRVVRRINEVTGTVYNNGEDMQIVRYEPGQFYKVRLAHAACMHARWCLRSMPLSV